MKGKRFFIIGALSILLLGMGVPLARGIPPGNSSIPRYPTGEATQSLSTVWYFAEGHTGSSFTEYLTLANPGATRATVQVKYLLGSGGPLLKSYQIAPYQRYTINVNNEIGAGKNVSLVVSSDVPVVAERPMYFTFGGTVPGGSDVLGATSLGTTFDFGYLDTSPGHSTFLAILNPNSASMARTTNYYSASGIRYVRTHTIAASSRGTVHVNAEGLPSGSYSALITLSAPGLVERPLYLQDTITGYTGAADLLGVPDAQTDWYFAEGFTASTFSERYILSNPTTTTADVTVTFYSSTGTAVNARRTLGPGQQEVVNANSVLGNGVNNSAWVHTTAGAQPVKILAERFMSFLYQSAVGTGQRATIPGATDVLGAAAPGQMYYFAEGYTGGQFGEWLTIGNPQSQEARVLVSFLPSNGATPTMRVYYIAPTSRFTLLTNPVMPNQSFSMLVQSSLPIMAERPVYFVYNGNQAGGTDVIGFQTAPPPLSTSCTPSTGVAPVSAVEISKWNNGKPQIALTFDAGGTDGVIATQILTILITHQVRATWFITGEWAQAHPSLLPQIRDGGMEIGNHTYDHPHLAGMNCQELNQADQIISGMTGRTTRPFWRPPYGERDTTVRQMAATLGYRTVTWSIDTIDWDPATTSQQIRDRVLNSVSPGAIVLMHAGSAVEAQTLDGLLTTLEQRGYQMVMISQLIQG